MTGAVVSDVVETHWLVQRLRNGDVPPAAVLRRWWADPSTPAPRVHRRGRPATGEGQDCGATFEMNPFGRPATRCLTHRRGAQRSTAATT